MDRLCGVSGMSASTPMSALDSVNPRLRTDPSKLRIPSARHGSSPDPPRSSTALARDDPTHATSCIPQCACWHCLLQ